MTDNIGKIIHISYEDNGAVSKQRYLEVPELDAELGDGTYRIAGHTVSYVLPDSKQAKTLANAEVGEEIYLGRIKTTIEGIYTHEDILMEEALKDKIAYESSGWMVSIDDALAAQEDTSQQRKLVKKGPKI